MAPPSQELESPANPERFILPPARLLRPPLRSPLATGWLGSPWSRKSASGLARVTEGLRSARPRPGSQPRPWRAFGASIPSPSRHTATPECPLAPQRSPLVTRWHGAAGGVAAHVYTESRLAVP